MLPEIIYNYNVSTLLCGNTDDLCNVARILYNNQTVYTRSVNKVMRLIQYNSVLIF